MPTRPARDIIDAVVENMRQNLEHLKYSTLAPSRYTVYLHATEFERLKDIVPVLQEETARALSDELSALNRRSQARDWIDRLTGRRWSGIRNAGADWQVEFLADPDGDLAEGDLVVDSALVLPTPPELGAGERTRRITTMHTGPHTTAKEQTQTSAPRSSVPPPAYARLAFEDDAGHHDYDVAKDYITIGRGGIVHPVDVRIASSPDVSREHARIRRDAASGRFFLIDLSAFGTTLNGRHVPRGVDEVDGAKRENGAETPLPDAARIGLADVVFLEFRKIG